MEQQLQGYFHPLTREVSKALEGALWPLGRDGLVAIARENDARRSVLTLLSGLPAGPYGSEAEVLERLASSPRPGTSA